MPNLTEEIEQLRQRMTEDARANEIELTRLGAEIENLETALIEQLRSVIQAHEHRRETFTAELRNFANGLSVPRPKHHASILDSLVHEMGQRHEQRPKKIAGRELAPN